MNGNKINNLEQKAQRNWHFCRALSASYDVYRVKAAGKHYLWCTAPAETLAEKLAVAACFTVAIATLLMLG